MNGHSVSTIIAFVFFWTSIFSFYSIFCAVASHCRPWMILMANNHILWHQAIFSLFSVSFPFYILYSSSFKTGRFSRRAAFAYFYSWSLRKQLSTVHGGLIWVIWDIAPFLSQKWVCFLSAYFYTTQIIFKGLKPCVVEMPPAPRLSS